MNLEDENLSTDYEDRCGNCQSFMEDSEKYCKFCGTAKGEGKFEPYKKTRRQMPSGFLYFKLCRE